MTEKKKRTLRDMLISDPFDEGVEELDVEIKELLGRLSGFEFAEAAIDRVRHYVAECHVLGFEAAGVVGREAISPLEFEQDVSRYLSRYIRYFMTEAHRRAIVEYHAQDCSTREAVDELIRRDRVMNRLNRADAIGYQRLLVLLVPRFAYLKLSRVNFPRKYFEVWYAARDAYKARQAEMPFTSRVELQALVGEFISDLGDKARDSVRYPDVAVVDIFSILTDLIKCQVQLIAAGERERGRRFSVSDGEALLEGLRRVPVSKKQSSRIEAIERLVSRYVFGPDGREALAEDSLEADAGSVSGDKRRDGEE